MRSTFVTSALLAIFASRALATIYITEPTASSVCTSGIGCSVRWNDDGNAPVLATIGTCSIGLYVGSQQQQTFLQDISDNLLVANQSFVQWIPNASVGPNNANYFIRFTSLSYKDPTNAMYPYMSFSSKFTLNGMTGNFNSSVQAQISAAISSSSPSSTASGSSSSATLASSTTPKPTVASSTHQGSSTTPSSTPSSTKSSSAMSKVDTGAFTSLLAIIVSAGLGLTI